MTKRVASSFCTARHKFGKEKEVELLERLQNNLGETINPTEERFSLKDYTSKNYNIELKSRRYYKSDKYSEWLVPACKFNDISKPLIIYYFWDGDQTLWRYDYNLDDKKDFTFRKSPISNQDHYDIPKRFFTQV